LENRLAPSGLRRQVASLLVSVRSGWGINQGCEQTLQATVREP